MATRCEDARSLANRAERRCTPIGRGIGPRDGSGPRGRGRGARVAKVSGPKGSITRISK